jgi:DNA modification methylase
MLKPYYEEDGIVLYHGDCREILPEVGPVDAVITDPPYGIRKLMQGGTWAKKNLYISDGAIWDSAPPAKEVFDLLLTKGQKIIIWGGNYFPLPPARCWLIWNKPERNFTLADAELAWTNLDKPVRTFDLPRLGRRPLHPTEKPLLLMSWCCSFVEGDTLDPFAGSGTTLVAAKQLGRKAIGIEIEESYCEIAANRLRNTTPSLFTPKRPQAEQLKLEAVA